MIRPAAPITGACDGCGAPGLLVWRAEGREMHDYYCNRCHRKNALYNAATEQLELLIEQAVLIWLSNWEGEPRVVDLGEQIQQLAWKLEDKYRAGELNTQEEVRAFHNAAD